MILPADAIDSYLAWLTEARRSPRTLYDYRRRLERGASLYPTAPLHEWTPEMMLRVLQVFPAASKAGARTTWNGLFRWAQDWDPDTILNPVDKLPSIRKPERKLIEVFTRAEQIRLEDQPDFRDHVLVALLFGTGIRKGEARQLLVEDVNLDTREVTIRRGKGGKGRKVGIGTELRDILRDLFIIDELDPVDHLWYYRAGNQHRRGHVRRDKPIGEATFQRWWVDIVQHAKVRYRKVHTTRHTFATEWLRAGGGIVELSKTLGHDNVDVTSKTYEHLVTDDIVAELDRVLAKQEAA